MRRLTHKEKGKKKVSDSGTDRYESDRRESDSEGTGDEPSKVKSASDTTSTWRIIMCT